MNRMRITSKHFLAFGKPFEVEVHITCFQPVQKAMLGMAFNTVEGTRILTLDSDTHAKYFDLEPGEYVLRAQLDRMPLHPGFYQFCASLAGGGHFYDMLDVALWEVKTSDEDHWSDRGMAGCRLEPCVTITPQERPTHATGPA